MDQIIDQIMALPEGTRIQVMAPVVRGARASMPRCWRTPAAAATSAPASTGMYELAEDIKLEKNIKHHIEIVVDRLIVRPTSLQRLTDSVETASNLSGGLVTVNLLKEEQDITFSQNYACEDCGISIEELTPRLFSFNSPFGACPTCTGLGVQLKVDPALVIPDESKSILDGAITAPGWNSIRSDGISRMYFDALSKKYHFSLRQPYAKLSDEVKDVILYGTRARSWSCTTTSPVARACCIRRLRASATIWSGGIRRRRATASKKEIESPVMSECPCPACQGKRLRPEALAVTVGGLSIYDATDLPVDDALAFFNG